MNPPLARCERGQAIAVLAVLIVALVGLLAYVVDTGSFLMAKREMQKAAQLGAEAAILDLVPDPTSDANQAAAVQTAIDVTTRNLAIPNALCTASPPQIVSPTVSPLQGVYKYVLPTGPQAGQFVFAVAVTIQCNAGFTFGRMLDLAQMPITVTATSALGSAYGDNCPIPFVVPQGPTPPINAANGFGWKPGPPPVLMPIGSQLTGAPPTITFSGQTDPLTPLNGVTTRVSQDDTIALQGNQAGASVLESWIMRQPCVPLSAGLNVLGSNGGTTNFSTGPLLSSFATRFGTTTYNSQLTLCPDGLDPTAGSSPVANGDWTLRRVSSCLATIPVLDSASYTTLLNTPSGNMANINVIGFNLFYIAYVAKDNGNNSGCANVSQWAGGGGGNLDCLLGYYLKPDNNAPLGAYTSVGIPIWRPVR